MSSQDIEEMAKLQAREEALQQLEEANCEALERILERMARCVPLSMANLRVAAAEILLRACGKHDYQTTPSDLFAQLVEAQDSGLQRVADSMGMELEQLGQEAEVVLAQEAKQFELQDMEGLDANVFAVQSCITPTIERLYPHECRIVQAYDVIKQAVPERFK